MTKAKINKAELKISERELLVAGSANTNRVQLTFSPDWDGLTKQITFTNRKSKECRRISANDSTCTVPWEVLASSGDVDCYLRGLDGNGQLVLRTNDENLGTVLTDSDDDAYEPAEATPDVLDELTAKVGALEGITVANPQPVSITLTDDGEGNISADRSYTELLQAVQDGRTVLEEAGGMRFYLTGISDGKLQYISLDDQPYCYDLSVSSGGQWHFACDLLISTHTLQTMLSLCNYATKSELQTAIGGVDELLGSGVIA